MLRTLLALFLLTSGIASAQTTSTPPSSVNFVEFEQSLVKIVVQSPAGINSVGTGFFVGDHIIASAAHVYLEAARAIVEGGGIMTAYKVFRDGHRFMVPIEFISADFAHDVVLLRFDSAAVNQQVPNFHVKALGLDDARPEIGESVAFFGYFAGDDFPILSRTTVAGYTSGGTAELLILDIPANPGQSGSPVFDLRSGKVLGVLASFVPSRGHACGSARPAVWSRQQ